MRIELVSLDIRNFKGIETKSFSFTKRVEIFGKNGTGKTTILDAFLWCLFGKDSSGASDFSVKRKNADGTDVHHIDVDVMAELHIDGQARSFRRRLVEKWTTPRGAKDPEFKGHEGEFFVNDVPVKAGEYQVQISTICREELFKLLTTAGAFNKLKDADRRRVLSEMADQVTDIDLAAGFPNVEEALKSGKTIEQYRDQIKSRKRRIADEKEQYPARLKENAEMRPAEVDFDALEQQKKELTEEIAGYDKQLKNPETADETQTRLEKDIRSYDEQIVEIEHSVDRDLSKKVREVGDAYTEKQRAYDAIKWDAETTKNRCEALERDIEKHKGTMAQIRKEWSAENARTCNPEVDTACPTCGKDYSQNDVTTRRNEIVAKFNEDKLKRLDDIRKRGDTESEYIAGLNTSLKEKETEFTKYEELLKVAEEELSQARAAAKNIPTKQMILEANIEHQNLKTKRDEAKAKLKASTSPTDEQEAIAGKKAEAEAKLKGVVRELGQKDIIARADQRKEELLEQQKKLGQEIADLEAIEFEILQFSMRKTDFIEVSVAKKFRFVRFKMFDHNITNDGAKEVCICTVNGVPYNDLNTAMQINADIDIINALSTHYGIAAPVFIDRAESINVIEETAGQRIDLYATSTDSSLRIVQK